MKRGFYTIMSAQFFSSLADNALLVAAIEMLKTTSAPPWQIPSLGAMFALFYVILAPFLGAFADAVPKGRVMFYSNGIKVVGCLLMLFGGHPLIAYAIVGLGAAAYSPAKYGILTELLPNSQLVKANGWIEGLTIMSIILGIALGGQLIGPVVSRHLLGIDLPMIDTGIVTAPESAIAVIVFLYLIAALFNLRIPRTEAPLQPLVHGVIGLMRDFSQLQRAAVVRQARPDLARDDDAVLGRVGQPAHHRLRLGDRRAGLHDDAGDLAGRRGGDRHRGRRDRRVAAHAAGPGDQRDPAGHPAGSAGDRVERRSPMSGWRRPSWSCWARSAAIMVVPMNALLQHRGAQPDGRRAGRSRCRTSTSRPASSACSARSTP